MNAISLFSGAMGLDIGLEKAGIDIRLCVEFNKLAASTIRENTRIPLIEKDINNVTTKEMLETAGLKEGEVELLVGGPPCQSFSLAGSKRGLDDSRGNLMTQYLRVLKEASPKYFILENVRGILSARLNYVPEEYKEYDGIKDKPGSVLTFLYNEFRKLGYTISFSLFNAANYGVPQVRERVLVFGAKGSKRIPLPQPTHSKDGRYGTKEWVTLGEAISGLGEPSHDEYISLRPKQLKYMPLIPEGGCWKNLPEDIQESLMGGWKNGGKKGGNTGFLRRLDRNKPSPTLVTSPTMPLTLLCHPTELRPLSIREYARIQQFPDTWRFKGSTMDIYKQIGNAVPVGLGYIAGLQVLKFDKGELEGNEDDSPKIPYCRYKNTTDKDFKFLKI